MSLPLPKFSLVASLLTLGACATTAESGALEASDEADMAIGSSEVRGATASVRVVHASADAPAVDVYIKGTAAPVIRNLQFGQTSNYLKVPVGAYEFVIRAAGSARRSAPVYTTPSLLLGAGQSITAVASGSLQGLLRGDAASAFRVLPLAENFSLNANRVAKLRIVHGGADAPSVGIDVGDDNPTAPEVGSLARFADTGAAGVSLPSGVPLQVGITAGGARVTSFTTPELPAGANLFAIATGFLAEAPDNFKKYSGNRDGFELLVVGPAGTIGFIKQNPLVYALHASPDAPMVDIFAGSARLYSGISFGELSSGLRVPPGAYTLDVFPAQMGPRPMAAPVFSYATPALGAGERYLAVARGFLAPGAGTSEAGFGITALAVTRAGTLNDDGTTFLHAVPDAPPVTIESRGFYKGSEGVVPNVFRDVAFGASGTKAYSAWYFSNEFRSASFTTLFAGVNPVARFDTTIPEQGFVVVAGALDPRRGASLRTIAIDVRGSRFSRSGVRPSFYNPWTVQTVFGRAPTTH